MTSVMASSSLPGHKGEGPDEGRPGEARSVQKAIEVLMNEHRLIERVLGSLETLTAEVEGGLVPERPLLVDFGMFFRDFADACHHGKEEDILFQRMTERGFPRDTGPVAVMLYEHKVGRGHVSALRQVGEGTGPLAPMETRLVLEHAGAFIPLLRTHILKEDRILYPMAMRLLTGPEMDAMEATFEVLEAQMHADGSYDRLHDLADRLTAAYRPDSGRIAAAAQLMACGG
jgi:hemerythrin-like domain-containing protein